MGANFEIMVLPGSLSVDQVKDRFANAQDEDRHENGHSYSGGFGMAKGLTFRTETFANRDGAYDFLDGTCVKWEDALAVRFKQDDQDFWMIGAVCAS